MLTVISHLSARQILDSRGYPTVECTCFLTNGLSGTASVPSGASTGSQEAFELRDDNPFDYDGKSVNKAVSNILTELSPSVSGEDPTEQEQIDQNLIEQDGTPNKSRLGANAVLAASMAIARTASLLKAVPLYQHLADLSGNDLTLKVPTPLFNIINGGLHAGKNLDFQEFIIVPNPNYLTDFPSQLQAAVNVTHSLGQVLKAHNLPQTVGDEGGYAPTIRNNQMAIELIKTACDQIQIDFSQTIKISFDFAANSYCKDHHYQLKDSPNPLNLSQYVTFLEKLIELYQPLSFEDPFPETEWDAWSAFTKKHHHHLVIIGDDLLVTNKTLLAKAITAQTCNAILIKPNQIGTVSETIETVNLAKKHHFYTVASHRSGETIDDFIADFAVGLGTDYVKFGAPIRGERVAKYNRLLQISSQLS